MSSPSVQRLADEIPEQGEQKFVLDADAARLVWRVTTSKLRLHHREADRPVTYHRTTYYDTPDYAFYRGTGSRHRRLRVREYATAPRPGAAPVLMPGCFVELKESAGGIRHKTRFELPHADVPAALARFHDGPLGACLMTWYQRSALSDATSDLRVTLDSRIAFCRPVPLGGPLSAMLPETAFARGPDYILEVKAQRELPPWLVLLLRGLRETLGFSKFQAGMQAAERRGLIAR
jgi:hypothetical protein